MHPGRFALIGAASALVLAVACTAQPEPASTSPAAAAPKVTAATLAQGREIYKANCAGCHGESGKGDGPGAGVFKPPPRDHTDRAYMSTLTDKDLADVIRMGGAMKGKPLMPSNPQLNGPTLEALVAYVRSLSEPRGN